MATKPLLGLVRVDKPRSKKTSTHPDGFNDLIKRPNIRDITD